MNIATVLDTTFDLDACLTVLINSTKLMNKNFLNLQKDCPYAKLSVSPLCFMQRQPPPKISRI